MKAIAKLNFSQGTGEFRIPTAPKWMTCTQGQDPNDWSCQIVRQGDIDNNVMIVEFQFLCDQADYLLEPGTKFDLFGSSQFKCKVEILSKID